MTIDREEKRRVQEAIDDSDKHMTALILWCKRQKKDAYALTDILGCGSTVALGIWDKYGNGWEGYQKMKAAK